MPELIARRNAVLNRLRVVSEARASGALSPLPGSRQSGSGPPPGVNLDRIRSQRECPDKDRSLFEFYAWQFTRPDLTAEHVSKLCFLAERDLGERLTTGEDSATRDRARNRSILATMYRGQPPEVVAACERCSRDHVRNHRRNNGLDPLTGHMVR